MVNDIKKHYSKMIFNSGPVQISDFVNNRYDVTHDKLYKNALNLLITDIAKTEYHKLFIIGESNLTSNHGTETDPNLSQEYQGIHMNLDEFVREFIPTYKKTHKFIEIKNDEYFKPSDVLCINIEFPYERKRYDLSKYWNKIQEQRNTKDVSLLYLDEDTIKYAELIYIDYVQGKCKFKSKLSGEEFWTTFDYTNENTSVSETYSLDNTFMYKIQNNLFENNNARKY